MEGVTPARPGRQPQESEEIKTFSSLKLREQLEILPTHNLGDEIAFRTKLSIIENQYKAMHFGEKRELTATLETTALMLQAKGHANLADIICKKFKIAITFERQLLELHNKRSDEIAFGHILTILDQRNRAMDSNEQFWTHKQLASMANTLSNKGYVELANLIYQTCNINSSFSDVTFPVNEEPGASNLGSSLIPNLTISSPAQKSIAASSAPLGEPVKASSKPRDQKAQDNALTAKMQELANFSIKSDADKDYYRKLCREAFQLLPIPSSDAVSLPKAHREIIELTICLAFTGKKTEATILANLCLRAHLFVKFDAGFHQECLDTADANVQMAQVRFKQAADDGNYAFALYFFACYSQAAGHNEEAATYYRKAITASQYSELPFVKSFFKSIPGQLGPGLNTKPFENDGPYSCLFPKAPDAPAKKSFTDAVRDKLGNVFKK